MTQFQPQVVVVPGASAGIGQAAAVARRGGRVALLARGEVGLRAAAQDVSARAGEQA